MLTEYNPYLLLAVFMIAAAGFALTPLLLAWLWAKKFSPENPAPIKTPSMNAVSNPRAMPGCNSIPNTTFTASFS